MSQKDKIGVVLFQLGGPDSPEAVEPFLYNLFCDPDIIDFPLSSIARQPLARLIARGRAKKVRASYGRMGGKSPIVEWTKRQAAALEDVLRKNPESGERLDARVVIAMRYWHPFTSEAIEALVSERCRELVLLPLYPQYSKTTTGSSFNEWQRRFIGSSCTGIPVRTIRDFHDHPAYINAVVEIIEKSLKKFAAGPAPHLVFSAHGVPVSVVQSGDPYEKQVHATTRLVMQRGGWGLGHEVCYQSKVGSARWLGPSIHEVIPRLASEGVRNVLVVPVSFVSDHIETLQEIDHEVREEAERAGIERFEMTPGLNDSPAFIRALAEMVYEAVGRPLEDARGRRSRQPLSTI